MKRFIAAMSMTLLLCLVIGGSGCILEEKIIELVLTNETSADFAVLDSSDSWNDPFTLSNYGDDLDEALEDAGYSRSDIKSATLMAGHYGVTEFSHGHDWDLTASITVERTDVPSGVATLIDYGTESVQGLLGQKKAASLNAAGVTIINDALTDFINGANPTLVFTLVSDNIEPDPSPTDKIEFDWRGWITIQILLEANVEVPDPF
jgi:hypothetical protein